MNTKKVTIIVLTIYIVLGIITAVIYALFGSFLSKRDERVVEYTIDSGESEAISANQETALSADAVLENTQEETTEENAEALEETVSPLDADIETHYYKFKAATEKTRLNIRREASDTAKIVGHFRRDEVGYVLEKGDDWSLVTNGDKTGYVSNEFVEFIEISQEEYPDEYKDNE